MLASFSCRSCSTAQNQVSAFDPCHKKRQLFFRGSLIPEPLMLQEVLVDMRIFSITHTCIHCLCQLTYFLLIFSVAWERLPLSPSALSYSIIYIPIPARSCQQVREGGATGLVESQECFNARGWHIEIATLLCIAAAAATAATHLLAAWPGFWPLFTGSTQALVGLHCFLPSVDVGVQRCTIQHNASCWQSPSATAGVLCLLVGELVMLDLLTGDRGGCCGVCRQTLNGCLAGQFCEAVGNWCTPWEWGQ